jgi:hypothetical protein
MSARRGGRVFSRSPPPLFVSLSSSSLLFVFSLSLLLREVRTDEHVAPLPAYVRLLAASEFVFSPRGHGWANHRDWEARARAGLVATSGRRYVSHQECDRSIIDRAPHE